VKQVLPQVHVITDCKELKGAKLMLAFNGTMSVPDFEESSQQFYS
jgi:hypothetical protein